MDERGLSLHPEGNYSLEFNFHNLETSFTPQVVGFGETHQGSFYILEISEYIFLNRTLLESNIAFCCHFYKNNYLRKKKLECAIPTFALHYANKTIELSNFIHLKKIDNHMKGIFYSSYSSIDFLGYLDKDTFIELSKADSLSLTFEVGGEQFEFDLQIPVIYEETFVTEGVEYRTNFWDYY